MVRIFIAFLIVIVTASGVYAQDKTSELLSYEAALETPPPPLESPYTLFDHTEVNFKEAPDQLRLEASVVWAQKSARPRSMEVRAELVDPFGLRKPREFTLKPQWEFLRPGLRFVLDVPLDQCEGATLVVWSLLVDGKQIKGTPAFTRWLGVRGGDACVSMDPKGPRGPWMVNTDVDEPDDNPGDGRCAIASNPVRCSLRAAVEESNAQPGPDEIGFTVNRVVLAKGASTLRAIGPVLIKGNGRNTTVISIPNMAEPLFSVFLRQIDINGVVTEMGDITVQNLTIAGPTAGRPANGIVYSGPTPRQAAVINADGRANFTDVTMDGVHGWAAGAIYAQSWLTLRRVEIKGATSQSPAAVFGYNAFILMEDSAIIDAASRTTIATLVGGQSQFTNSTIGDSTIQIGDSALRVVGSSATLQLRHMTIAGNQGLRNGAVHAAGREVSLSHVLFANPETDSAIQSGVRTQAECSVGSGGQVLSFGYNLLDNIDGCPIPAAAGDQFGVGAVIDPQLAPLAFGGAGTRSYPLLPNSPARDAGNPAAPNPAQPSGCLSTDQFAVSRPQNGRCDIGATEQ
jgi:CSLREA domain-containing protein